MPYLCYQTNLSSDICTVFLIPLSFLHSFNSTNLLFRKIQFIKFVLCSIFLSFGQEASLASSSVNPGLLNGSSNVFIQSPLRCRTIIGIILIHCYNFIILCLNERSNMERNTFILKIGFILKQLFSNAFAS